MEWLNFLRFNQELRSWEYVYLSDAINNDGYAQNVETIIILPSSYAKSLRHMFVYAQNVMS